MKSILALFFLLGLSFTAVAQEKSKYDPVAILILDRMSDFIGGMESCQFSISASHDVSDEKYGQLKHHFTAEVSMMGPNKMVINGHGTKHRQWWYNGEQIAVYDYDEMNFAVVDAPATILGTIDSLHTHFDVDFPAADFFYPAFTDDVLENSTMLDYIGISDVNGKECFHVAASNADQRVEFWISNDNYNLPVKYVITYTSKKGHPQYDVDFTNWQINPTLPDAMFEFMPPPGSHEVRLLAKGDQ